jgi:hypothetical protein
MKRFVNTYSILRAVRTLEGNAVAAESLALWAIIESRWPSLADYLREKPEAIEYVGRLNGHDGHGVPEQLVPLFSNLAVARVVSFHEGQPLTQDAVRECCGEAD